MMQHIGQLKILKKKGYSKEQNVTKANKWNVMEKDCNRNNNKRKSIMQINNGQLVQERIELSQETKGHPQTQEDEGHLDQHKVFYFDAVEGHSQVRQTA